jgi:mRNA interferase MazF
MFHDDSFDATDSIAICVWPSNRNERNGLLAICRLMVDKITTVPKSKIGANIGRLDDADILRLNQAVIVFLGLAVSPRLKP